MLVWGHESLMGAAGRRQRCRRLRAVLGRGGSVMEEYMTQAIEESAMAKI